jgi:ABC-type transport system substrate-binding protein
MMRIGKNTLLFILGFTVLSCGGDKVANEQVENVSEETRYGGVFKLPITSYFLGNDINEIQKLESSQVYGQIFESLVKYDPKTLEVKASLAEKWRISEDGLIYQFVLRDSIFFHDHMCFENGKGRMLVPEDVVFSFMKVYQPKETNSAYSLFRNTIVGGDEFQNGTADSISGIYTSGDTVFFELIKPNSDFIKKIATVFGSIIPAEAYDGDNFQLVGTGPFIYDVENSSSEKVTLYKNVNYHNKDEFGNQLPYLDSVLFVYYGNKEDQMELFWNKELSFIPEVPVNKISEVLEDRIDDFENDPPKFILSSEPQLATTYLELNMQSKIFKNKKVRQAINFAINRKKIVEKILKNQAYEIGKYGIVPPLPKVFDDYDFESIEAVSYVYNPERAKILLAEAGYADGKNFPTLEMQFKEGTTSYLVASEIQSQLLSVLNINLEIEAIEFNKLLENKANGKADIFRTNWVADFPSPAALLGNAYSGVIPANGNDPSYLNSSRYKNPAFDKHFENATRTMDKKEAAASFNSAEAVLMDDAVFIILWYGEDLSLQQSNLRNFETNGIGYLDLSSVYLKERKAEEKE